MSQKARLPCPEIGMSSSWPHAYSTYAPQLSLIASFTALRLLQLHFTYPVPRRSWSMQDLIIVSLHILFQTYLPDTVLSCKRYIQLTAQGTAQGEWQHPSQKLLLYLSVSSTGVPDSGGSLRTSSTLAETSTGASFHSDCTLAAAASRAATSFTAAATAVKFVFGACTHATKSTLNVQARG